MRSHRALGIKNRVYKLLKWSFPRVAHLSCSCLCLSSSCSLSAFSRASLRCSASLALYVSTEMSWADLDTSVMDRDIVSGAFDTGVASLTHTAGVDATMAAGVGSTDGGSAAVVEGAVATAGGVADGVPGASDGLDSFSFGRSWICLITG